MKKESGTTKSRSTKGKKKWRIFFVRKRVILLSILVALIVFRLFLPMIVKRYVNRVLNRIPGYYGWVDDIDIALYRGAYVINGLHLYEKKSKKPFLDFDKTDISIQWKALFNGRIVSEIEMYKPKVTLYITGNDVADPSGKNPRHNDWTRALDKLVPIDINRLVVHNGQFLYADIIESPDINLNLNDVEMTALNLSNVVDKKKTLPSTVRLTAISFGNGRVILNGNMNMMKRVPDFDANLSLKKADVTALNELSLAVAGFDFEKGQFELYAEAAVDKGYLKGYVKPMFHDITIPDSFKDKNSSVLKRIWEGVITIVGFILKNKKRDSFATKIPLEGDLNDPKVGVWKTITNIFRNGFIEAFKNQVDNDINFKDVSNKK